MTDKNTCKCGRTNTGISIFSNSFRKYELKVGHPDPGIICGLCCAQIAQTYSTSEQADIIEFMCAELRLTQQEKAEAEGIARHVLVDSPIRQDG